MEQASPPEHIVDEAIKRNLDCIPESIASKLQEEISPTIMIYDADFSQSALDNLLSTDVEKTDFDFSKYKIANNHRNLECRFSINKVSYKDSVEGEIESSRAEGYLEIDSGKVNINANSRWKRGGLSTDPKYLRDEVNLRLTEDGYLVGKMAYFEWVGAGEPPKLPIYPRLLKHKKSRPLNYKNAIKESAKFWLEKTLDWSDAILYLNCTMKDGKLDGKRTIWYKSGQIKSEENYKDGQREGKSRVWYENGQIKSERNYKDDLLDGKSTKWRENGQKESERNYIWGDLEGIQTSWYENGQIKTEENRKFGKYYGKRTNWYKDGQIMSEENYKDGNKEGKYTTWYEDGQIKAERNYKNGKCTSGC